MQKCGQEKMDFLHNYIIHQEWSMETGETKYKAVLFC